MKAAAEENPFKLEDLVVKPGAGTVGAKTSAKAERGAAPRSKERFIQISASQARRLEGATSLVTERVFRHLLFREFKAYYKPFVLPCDALAYAGINRFAQARALRSLAKLGLILVERDSPRSPPMITIVGGVKPV
jgi:hypothetical protein